MTVFFIDCIYWSSFYTAFDPSFIYFLFDPKFFVVKGKYIFEILNLKARLSVYKCYPLV